MNIADQIRAQVVPSNPQQAQALGRIADELDAKARDISVIASDENQDDNWPGYVSGIASSLGSP